MGPEILQFHKLQGDADSAGSGTTLSVARGYRDKRWEGQFRCGKYLMKEVTFGRVFEWQEEFHKAEMMRKRWKTLQVAEKHE